MHTIIVWSRDNPIKVIISILLLTTFSITRLPYLKIDATIQEMFTAAHPEQEFYQETEYKFTSDVITSIYIKDKELFTPEKISLLEKLTLKFEEIEEIEKVASLFNTINFYNDGAMLNNVPLFDPLPIDQIEMDKAFDIGLKNPLFVNQFLSADKQTMTIVLYAEKGNHDTGYYQRLAKKVDIELAPLENEFEQIFQIGIPKLSWHAIKGMARDQIIFIPLAVLVIPLILLIGFSSIIASLLPILVGSISVLWTIAFMTLVNIDAQILISTVPIILLIISSTQHYHMISKYLEGLHIAKNRKKAIEYASKKVAFPISLTTILMVVGLLSITMNEVMILKEFAIVTAVGLVLNFFVTATLTPVYLNFLGEKVPHQITDQALLTNFYNKLSKLLLDLARFHKKKVLIGLIITITFCTWQSGYIYTDIDNLSILKKSHPFIKKINLINKNYKAGMNSLLVVFKTKGDKPFKKSRAMKKIFEIHQHINKTWKKGVSQSLVGTLALINRELNKGNPKEYRIPDQDNLISKYMLFLSKDDWQAYITPDYKEMNLIIRHKLSSSVEIEKVLEVLTKDFQKILAGTNITFKFTSAMVVQAAAAKTLIKSQIKGILLILVTIFIIIWILFLDIRTALLSLVPSIVPVVGLFGIMGFLKIPLDIGTCIIATMVIAFVTGGTLHFFTCFNDCLKIYDDQIQAMRHTIQQEIKPVMTTSITLAIGLAILAFSNFRPIIEFGILSSVTMILALISQLVITPIMLLGTSQKEFISVIDLYSSKLRPKLLENSPVLNNCSFDEAKIIFLMAKIKEYSPDEIFDIIDSRSNHDNHYLVSSGNIIVEKKGYSRSSDNPSIRIEDVEKSVNIELARLGPGTLVSAQRFTNGSQLKISDSVTLILINQNLVKRLSAKNKSLSEKLSSNLHSLLLKPLI
jgi:uncharacterized protein